MLSIVILMKNMLFFFKTLIFDGCFEKYRLNVPFCDDIRRCLYFLEYALPNSTILISDTVFYCLNI